MVDTDPVSDIVKRVGTPMDEDTDDTIRAFLVSYTAKELRSACKIYHVKVRSKSANIDNKVGYENVLVQLARSRRESEEAACDERTKLHLTSPSNAVGSRKTRHCGFRLLNVLFSDHFVEQLGQMGVRPTRRELDAGAVRGRNAFWLEVAIEFAKDRPEYGRLVSTDTRFFVINPHHIVSHAGEKLQQIWKDVTQKFALAHARATQSGTHETDFYEFCSGQVEPLYLSAWLSVRPQAFDAALGGMPKRCSLDTLLDDSTNEDHEASEGAPVSKRRRIDTSDVITYLESRFGSNKERDREQQAQVRARVFAELEKLANSLRATKAAGMSAEVARRLEQKVELYVQRVEDLDDED